MILFVIQKYNTAARVCSLPCRSAPPGPETRLRPRDLADMQTRRDTMTTRRSSTNARNSRVIDGTRAQGRRRRAEARRIASRASLRSSLRRDRTLRCICASEGGFKRWRETRLDLTGEFADEDGAVFAAERGDGLVYSVALYEKRAVRVDVADGAEDAEEVELDDCFAVGELFGDAAEELRLGDADCNGG